MKKISTNSLPVLSSADSGWENILVKQYNLPAGESPDDLEFLEHIINIQLSQKLLKMEWQFNGEKIQSKQMNTGEVCLTPAGSSLLNRWYSPAEFLLIKINPQLIDRAAFHTNKFEIIPKWGIYDPQILHIAFALKAEVETGFLSGNLYVDFLALAMTARIVKLYSTTKKVITRPPGKLAKNELEKIIDYINAHLDTKITLFKIANLIHLSPYHFSRIFKKSTGITLHQYVIKCRIDRAKLLLTKTDLSLAEIALRIGTTNQSNFTAFFRKQVGVSPKVYRDLLL